MSAPAILSAPSPSEATSSSSPYTVGPLAGLVSGDGPYYPIFAATIAEAVPDHPLLSPLGRPQSSLPETTHAPASEARAGTSWWQREASNGPAPLNSEISANPRGIPSQLDPLIAEVGIASSRPGTSAYPETQLPVFNQEFTPADAAQDPLENVLAQRALIIDQAIQANLPRSTGPSLNLSDAVVGSAPEIVSFGRFAERQQQMLRHLTHLPDDLSEYAPGAVQPWIHMQHTLGVFNSRLWLRQARSSFRYHLDLARS